jgi:methionine-gamma-lyase
MSLSKDARIETKAIHGGDFPDAHGSVVTPIYQVSTFAFENAKHGADLFAGKRKGFIYSRMLNPTVESLENQLTTLESGHKAIATSSGMAAIHTALVSLLSQGDHLICSEAVYGPTSTLTGTFLKRFGVETSFVDTSDLAAVEAAIRPNTKAIFVESPGNPTLAVSDIAAIATIAKRISARLVVDNTFMSPILQRPLELGADLVVHSMTKFLNGHADVVAGCIVCPDEDLYKQCRTTLNLIGGVIDPHQAWLVQRGIKTLALRMERHSENGLKLATWLEAQDCVARVWYPGLPSHPNYEVAQKQHIGPGGMIAFELQGGLEAGQKLMDSVKLFKLAVSLGGVESLIQHPASMTHAGMSAELRQQAGISDGLVRISIGVEHVDDLLADLQKGLA